MPHASPPRIVGLALLRNEEYFGPWALRNIADFCDEIRVLDHHSTDRTPRLLQALAAEIPHLDCQLIDDPNRSQAALEDLAGTPTWVFGVDGDEIWDPDGLARLRPRLLAGEFDDVWRVTGHMLHVTGIDLAAGRAQGHAPPHAPTGAKLFNFAAISSWPQADRERLHGGNMVFRRPGWTPNRIRELHLEASWDTCDLRALHLCFHRRSAGEGPPDTRRNPAELRASRYRAWLERGRNLAAGLVRGEGLSVTTYKARRYARGPVVEADIRSFGGPARDGGGLLGEVGQEARAILARGGSPR